MSQPFTRIVSRDKTFIWHMYVYIYIYINHIRKGKVQTCA